MQKQKWICGILIVLLLVFGIGIWQHGITERTKLEVMCKASASAALEHFETYNAERKESDYLAGVAEFRSFMTTYLCLTDEAGQAEYLWCSEVYGGMILHPETIQEHLSTLMDALRNLAGDYDDPNGFQGLSRLVNVLAVG